MKQLYSTAYWNNSRLYNTNTNICINKTIAMKEDGAIQMGFYRIEYQYDFDPIICCVKVNDITIDLEDDEQDELITNVIDELVEVYNRTKMSIEDSMIMSDIEDYLSSNYCKYNKQIK